VFSLKTGDCLDPSGQSYTLTSCDTPHEAEVFATFALGTSAGDFTATTLGLGYLASVVLFFAAIVVPAIAWLLGLNAVAAFWMSYIVTRPLGASFADYISKPKNLGGLNFGDGPTALLFALGFAVITVASMLWTTIDPGLKVFYERTIAAQAGRSSPFSIWGQDEALEPIRVAILAATGVLAVALAVVPRKKSLLQVAALGAALMLGVQITLHHWFYLYIVWFFPLMLIALALLERSEEPEPEDVPSLGRRRFRRRAPEPSPARSTPPVPTG